MIYKFITTEDLNRHINAELLSSAYATDNLKNAAIADAEKFAIQEIRNKLNSRLDVNAIFKVIKQWNNTDTFAIDAHVYDDGLIYKCLVANTNLKPADNPTQWVLDEPRERVIVGHCAAITAFETLKSVNSAKIPKNLAEARKEAIQWLKDVRDGIENPEIQDKVNSSNGIPYSSGIDKTAYFF